ncbi:MAG: hypothetical protein LBT01_06065 [Spirochaetaceae bacterium]|jgi:hypothetical protein|nr:hypothetical protein [Spirochaetaceae bacterium]
MKILGLLGGLYTELKRLNDNLERLTASNEKKQRDQENPLSEMTGTEIFELKQWINSRFSAKGISLEAAALGDDYIKGRIEYFFTSKKSTKTARDAIAAALGYANFSDLAEAWRKGGAA